MADVTRDVDEGDILNHSFTFDDFGFIPDVVLGWNIDSINYSGTAVKDVDYTFSWAVTDASIDVTFTALRDNEVEGRETATIAITAYIDYVDVPDANAQYYENINGDLIYGTKKREPIDVSADVNIHDGPACISEREAYALTQKLEKLKILQASYNRLDQAVDDAQAGHKIHDRAEKAFDIGNAVGAETLWAFRNSPEFREIKPELADLSASLHDLRKELEAPYNTFDFTRLNVSADNVVNNFRIVAEEAQRLGADIPEPPDPDLPGFNSDEWLADFAIGGLIDGLIARYLPELPLIALEGTFWAIEKRREEFSDMSIDAQIETQLERVQPDIALLATSLDIHFPEFNDSNQLLDALGGILEDRIMEIQSELSECGMQMDSADALLL